MLTIKKEQQQVFSDFTFKSFEEDMVEHVKKFFPNHFIAMQESNTRNTIRYGYAQAKKYGLDTQRNVCLYLNNMLVLGSNFDTDPQYTWAQEILKNVNEYGFRMRIDTLSDMTLEVFGKISGHHHKYLNRALLNISNNSTDIYAKIMKNDLKFTLQILNDLFAKKVEVVGEVNLNHLTKHGIEKANSYGITSEPNILMYIVFMFLSGAGFDTDPQFPWASEILNDIKITNQDQKIKLLLDKAVGNLKGFLSQYNPSFN